MHQEQVAAEMMPEIYKAARRVKMCVVRRVCIDDLVSDGCLGLVRAFTKYEPARGVPFEPYAKKMIRWAMLDGLQDRDLLTTKQRKDVKNGMAMNVEEINGLDFNNDDDPAMRVLNWTAETHWRHQRRAQRMHDRLVLALEYLSERDRAVVCRYYLKGEKQRDISADLGLSLGRVSQIVSESLVRLREVLDEVA